MKAAVRVLLTVPTTVLALAAGTMPAVATEPAPTRVLVVGDSLAQGVGGDWTWRHWLWREVKRQQAAVDFVGPDTAVTAGYGTRYERATSWDSAHNARAGTTVDFHQARIASVLRTYTPEVVIVQLGLNDLNRGDTAAILVTQLKRFLETLWEVRPGVRVVLAEIPNTGRPTLDIAGAQVNLAMSQWIAGKPAVLAHNRSGEGSGTLAWDPSRFTLDGVHPNATGQTLYAHRFAQALRRLGVLPAPVGRVYHERAWAPSLRPQVSRLANGVRVGWEQTTTEVFVQYVRVVIDGRSATGWIRTPRRGDTQTMSFPLPRGEHQVRLVGRRGTMVSTWGPAVPVVLR